MNEFRGILEHIGRTPLVPLRRLAAGLPVSVLVKCEHMNPGGSVKDRIALAIVADAEARGLLAPGATLIEATAGGGPGSRTGGTTVSGSAPSNSPSRRIAVTSQRRTCGGGLSYFSEQASRCWAEAT